jgi:DNA repair protein RecO (recombination protein O)
MITRVGGAVPFALRGSPFYLSPMPQISTTAIVLHAFPYGDTSKIVRIATGDLGVLSVVAKGAHRPKSRFGACIQPFSEGTALLYVKQSRDLQTLAEFDVHMQRHELAANVHRYSTAAAAAEIVLRFSPEGPHPEVFDVLRQTLDWLVEAPAESIAAVALASLWSLVCVLGFEPALVACAIDERPLAPGNAWFAVAEGGLLCPICARSRETANLTPEDRDVLTALVAGSLPPTALGSRHAAAHRRLLARFVRCHVAEGRELPALEFWEHAG